MEQDSLKKNAILNIIYKISSLVFPLVTYPYVSRILLADNLGKVSFFNSLTSYMMMIGSLGISTYGIRAIAKVRDDKDKLSIVTKELVRINVIVTFIVLCIIFVTVPFVSKFHSNISLLLISCVQTAIAPFSMEWLYSGLEQYSYIAKRAISIKIISLVLIFLLVHNRDDYVIYAAIMAFGFVGNYICNIVHSAQIINYKVHAHLQLKRHLKSIIILFASALAINIYTNVDTVMLGFINGDRAVGLYDVSCKAKLVLLSLINAISMVLFPRLSHYLAINDYKSYNATLKKAIITIMGIAIPIAVFFEIEAKNVILVLGGKDYSDAALCMQLLMPVLVISGFSNITGNQILLPHGLDSSYMQAVCLGAFVDIILNIFLMPKYSLYGAAIATLLAEITQMTVQILRSWKYLKNSIDVREIKKVILASMIAGGTIYFMSKCISGIAIINLSLFSLFFLIIYVIALVVFKSKVIHR